VLLDAKSAVVDVGRSERVVPGATRRALNVRDKGCRWPGCDRTASWTAAHRAVDNDSRTALLTEQSLQIAVGLRPGDDPVASGWGEPSTLPTRQPGGSSPCGGDEPCGAGQSAAPTETRVREKLISARECG
jgi:hypothetical protein